MPKLFAIFAGCFYFALLLDYDDKTG